MALVAMRLYLIFVIKGKVFMIGATVYAKSQEGKHKSKKTRASSSKAMKIRKGEKSTSNPMIRSNNIMMDKDGSSRHRTSNLVSP